MRHTNHYPTIETATIDCVLLTDEYQDLAVEVDYDYYQIGMHIYITDYSYDYDPLATKTHRSTLDAMVEEFIAMNFTAMKVTFEV